MGRGTEETFFQRRHTNAQQEDEKMLNITNNGEMQVKTTTKYHFTPIRVATVKKIASVDEDVEKRELLCVPLMGM